MSGRFGEVTAIHIGTLKIVEERGDEYGGPKTAATTSESHDHAKQQSRCASPTPRVVGVTLDIVQQKTAPVAHITN